MATSSQRFLSLATLLLCGLLLGLPWSMGGRSPAGLALAVLLPVLAALCVATGRRSAPLFRPSPLLLLAALLAGGSALRSIYPDRTVQSLLLLLAYLLVATVSAHVSGDAPGTERLLLGALAASGAGVAVVGALRLYQGGDGGLYARVLTGPFGYPNAAAGFLILAGGGALTLARDRRHRWARVSGIAAAAGCALALLLTHSRGAVLAAAVGLAAWAATEATGRWPRRRLWVGALGGGALAAAALGIPWLTHYPAPLWQFLESSARDTSYLWRVQILEATWAMLREHPWWGVGPGAFPVALLHYQRLPYVSGENPHNLYLELAAEYGAPFALLAVALFGALLLRVGVPIAHRQGEETARRRLGPLLVTLVAFLAHSAVDLDWSFPASAVAAATVGGVAWGLSRRRPDLPVHSGRLWNGALMLLFGAAALLSLGRYYAATLVEAGRLSLSVQDVPRAQRELALALSLNPLSFSARRDSAWAHVRSGDPERAIAVAEHAARIAPLDPNSQFLAGEIALAGGQRDVAERHLRDAVDRAPSTQLRYYAGLLEALMRGGQPSEARFWYERALRAFAPGRVLSDEARCLAPGDRYLLARMSRRVTPLYREAGEISQAAESLALAQALSKPDLRGICASTGSGDQTSPERAVGAFWQAFTEGGLRAAERILVPDLRGPTDNFKTGHPPTPGHSVGGRVVRIAALDGNEHRVSLQYEIEITHPGEPGPPRCAYTTLRMIQGQWFLEELPRLARGSCEPVW